MIILTVRTSIVSLRHCKSRKEVERPCSSLILNGCNCDVVVISFSQGMKNDTEEGTLLGTFTYDENGESTQTFQLPVSSKLTQHKQTWYSQKSRTWSIYFMFDLKCVRLVSVECHRALISLFIIFFLSLFLFSSFLLCPPPIPNMQNPSDEVYRYVELRVLSNWGHVEYTCLYRFRVHGKIVSTWDSLNATWQLTPVYKTVHLQHNLDWWSNVSLGLVWIHIRD